jgi:hypothetical protein
MAFPYAENLSLLHMPKAFPQVKLYAGFLGVDSEGFSA